MSTGSIKAQIDREMMHARGACNDKMRMYHEQQVQKIQMELLAAQQCEENNRLMKLQRDEMKKQQRRMEEETYATQYSTEVPRVHEEVKLVKRLSANTLKMVDEMDEAIERYDERIYNLMYKDGKMLPFEEIELEALNALMDEKNILVDRLVDLDVQAPSTVWEASNERAFNMISARLDAEAKEEERQRKANRTPEEILAEARQKEAKAEMVVNTLNIKDKAEREELKNRCMHLDKDERAVLKKANYQTDVTCKKGNAKALGLIIFCTALIGGFCYWLCTNFGGGFM